MTQIKKKKRTFKNTTPGQSRDYDELSAHRMFKAYEDTPANSTGPAIANWDPPLGKSTKVMYKKKKRELDMETLQTDNRIDGRTKSYREAVRRIRERQEKMKERKTNDNVNQFALQAANPFGKEVDEIHSPKDRTSTDAAIAAWTKAGGKTKKLKPGQPKGMPKKRKELLKKEEVEMKNKYLKIKPGSIEDAALSSLLTAAGENPNDYRPTLHLPEKKYLNTKEGSLERAVEEALTEKPQPYKLPRQLKDPKKEKMVGTPTGTKVVDKKDPKYKGAPEHESHDVENMIQFGKPFTVGEDDDRRTVDAIRAYDKSKDASRDADWDTVHGKIKQGKKEKKYAKKERGEIDKDDPNWKNRAYHTGMHGEEKEMSPMIKATMDKIHSMREDKLSYKERQGLSKSQFALPGKGEGPEGKQGGSYPIPDESHARNALARVSQHGSEAEKRKVKSAVEKKFPDIKVSEETEWAKSKRIDREVSAKLIKTQNEREARYQAQQKAKKQAESKEAENGERDVGSNAYANYVKGLTPGQETDSAVTGKNAKKESAISKKNTDEKARNAGLEDEYVPTLEEYTTYLESLEGVALDAELETLSQNELLELLGTGLVKKAAKGIVKRFSAGGRLAAAKKKGAKIKTKSDIMTQKTSNIAAKAKLKAQKAGFKDAKKKAKSAGAPAAAPAKPAAPAAAPAKPASGGLGDRIKSSGVPKAKPAKPKLKLAAEYDPETLVGRAMLELSKKTLGSYVKKASTSKSDSAMALQRSTDKPGGQTRGDVNKHVGKMIKRDKGIGKAVDKLTK